MNLTEFNFIEDDTIYDTHSLFHHEYYIIDNDKKVGELQLTYEVNFVTLTLFKIYEEDRFKGYGKKALAYIEKEIQKQTKYTVKSIFITVAPYADGELDKDDLVVFYEKYLKMRVYFRDNIETLMIKEY